MKTATRTKFRAKPAWIPSGIQCFASRTPTASTTTAFASHGVRTRTRSGSESQTSR